MNVSSMEEKISQKVATKTSNNDYLHIYLTILQTSENRDLTAMCDDLLLKLDGVAAAAAGNS